MGSLLDFLFGRAPKIFDKNGEVRHELPKEKWESWSNRYKLGAEYNWKNHTAVRGDSIPNTKKPST